jgi:hypothetical protein
LIVDTALRLGRLTELDGDDDDDDDVVVVDVEGPAGTSPTVGVGLFSDFTEYSDTILILIRDVRFLGLCLTIVPFSSSVER